MCIRDSMPRLLPGISSLLISTPPVHSPAFFSKTSPLSLIHISEPTRRATISYAVFFCISSPHFIPRSGELRTQKLKFHLLRTQSLKSLRLKPGVGEYIAIHAKLTARDVFLANFCPSGPFTCIFSKPVLSFNCVSCGYHWFLYRPAD